MNLTHKGCGGEIVEDEYLPGYLYDSNEDGRPETVPAYSCAKCGAEILGDSMIDLPEEEEA